MQRLEGVGISIYVMDTVEIMDEVKNDGLYKVERSRPRARIHPIVFSTPFFQKRGKHCQL